MRKLNFSFYSLVFVTTLLTQSVFARTHEVKKMCGLHCDTLRSEDDQAREALNSFSKINEPNSQSCNPPATGESPSVEGARMVMAQVYGTCDVLKLPAREFLDPQGISSSVQYVHVNTGDKYPRNAVSSKSVSLLGDTHPYLQTFKDSECYNRKTCEAKMKAEPPKSNVCLKASCDPILHPPTYQYGAKVYDATTPYQIRQFSAGPSNGLDCSFFVSEALMVKGLRMVPNKDPPSAGPGGTGVYTGYGAKDAKGVALDCFDRINTVPGIQSGDVLVAPNNHMVMVDTVGADPFGLKPILEGLSPEMLEQEYKNYCHDVKKKPLTGSVQSLIDGTSTQLPQDQARYLNEVAEVACSTYVSIQNFQMTIIHSSPHGNKVGVQREVVAKGLEGVLETALEVKARHDCILGFREKWKKYAPALLTVPSKAAATYEAKLSAYGTPKVLRHQGDRAGCVGRPLPLKSLACSSCCDLRSSYNSMISIKSDGETAK